MQLQSSYILSVLTVTCPVARRWLVTILLTVIITNMRWWRRRRMSKRWVRIVVSGGCQCSVPIKVRICKKKLQIVSVLVKIKSEGNITAMIKCFTLNASCIAFCTSFHVFSLNIYTQNEIRWVIVPYACQDWSSVILIMQILHIELENCCIWLITHTRQSWTSHNWR